MWGVGVSLYEAVTGRLPFPEMIPADRHPQLDLEPEALEADVPAPIMDLIAACLRREPSRRPTAKALGKSLEPLVAALPRRPVLNRIRPQL